MKTGSLESANKAQDQGFYSVTIFVLWNVSLSFLKNTGQKNQTLKDFFFITSLFLKHDSFNQQINILMIMEKARNDKVC